MIHTIPPLKVAGIAAASWFVAMVIDPSVFAAATVTVIMAVAGATVMIIKAGTESKKELLEAAAKHAAAAALAAVTSGQKIGEVHEETKGIAHNVNGAASKQVDRIDELEQRIERLIRQLAESKETAVALAATTAVSIPAADVARAKGKAEGVEEERTRGAKASRDRRTP